MKKTLALILAAIMPASLFAAEFGGKVATFDMKPEEICGYFKDIFHFSCGCRFSNCTHTHEPGCAVLKAVEDHYIAPSRYASYLSMLDDEEDSKYRKAY